ncbi:MAG TPA: aminotransferase class III-fold pyridoxal phosphate-dependent enzyme [Caulobacteraceae bacterium]|nr:aminotransferase class III-fold pyridoxal phosphate-dependent enzyme [Caulobacteraceae bacterium]
MSRQDALKQRAQSVFPRGIYGHLSTRTMPENYPQFFSSAKGVRMTDVDGRTYIDYMCAFGLNLFGYGDEEINAAFVRQMQQTDTLTGVSPVMVEFAERFTGIVAHADWALFVKNGTDATLLGAMIARAHTKRDKIIVAEGAYHGMAPWSSASPGVTAAERSGKIPCVYNDLASLERAVADAGDDLAAIFATPFKHDVLIDQAEPDAAYARRARELCDRTGALLVVDDVRAGFKLARDCSWATVGVEPDLSAWGKCIANGHPISALLGSDKARKAATEVRYTGSYWFQSAPMAAGLVTLDRIMNTPYLEHIRTLGRVLRDGMAKAAGKHGVGLRQTGPVTMPMFLFDDDPDLRKGYRFCAEMVDRGVYMHPFHNMFISNALTMADVAETLEAADEALKALADAAPALAPNTRLAALSA